MSEFEDLKIVILVAAIVAFIASGSVIVTFWTFAPIRSKRFMKFIYYMSLCDLMFAICTLFGFPSSGSALCDAQAFMSIYFSLASWCWTTCLSYVTYSIIVYGSCKISDVVFHILCWSVPLILTLIPLSNAAYGTSESTQLQWCLIVNDSKSPSNADFVWGYAMYFGWLFAFCLCMLYWKMRVQWMLYKRKDGLSDVVARTYDRVSLYPLAMISLWIWNYLCIEIPAGANNTLSAISMLTGVSYGTVTALIFWIKSSECRARWYDLLFPPANFDRTTTITPIDFDEDKLAESMVMICSAQNISTESASKEGANILHNFRNMRYNDRYSESSVRISYNSEFEVPTPSRSIDVHSI